VSTGTGAVTRGDVAKGAGLAGVARLGAAVDALAQPLYVWLFGLATYGLYVVLWGAINLLSITIDLGMSSALQRAVPTARSEEQAHGAVKFALLVTVVPAFLVAVLVALNADALAGIFAAAPEDRETVPQAIRIFVWTLPLWTFVEVATSAVRARRAFGPEIRLRIFWEQLARILFALMFFAVGLRSLGLVAAHLCSIGVTAILCVPLLARYFDLRLLLSAPVDRALRRSLVGSGLALLPSNLSRRLLIDAPPLVLNLMLPGARGATAAGLFEIGRKISTIPLIVRQAFQYVMGPLSSAQAHVERAALAPLYRFASRASTALVVPLSGLLIFAGADILSIYRAEAAAALPILYILVAARAIEAIVGPATPIVEMTGHRALPTLNSVIGVAVWALLAILLVPDMGGIGMAIAVAAATVVISYAATIELRISDGLTPFDRKLFLGLAIALAGVALMALAENLTRGPARFVSVLSLWAITSWCALRFGLVRGDREALGGFARALRLVPKDGRPLARAGDLS
jgi:O-antigen/teichoic acid export membrane protein